MEEFTEKVMQNAFDATVVGVHARLEAVDALEAALEAVEWVSDVDRQDSQCPWCLKWEGKNGYFALGVHAPDCQRQLALACASTGRRLARAVRAKDINK